MSENVTLYHHSNIHQHAYSDGRRHTMQPFEIRVLPPDVAQLFLAQRGQFVQPYVVASIPRIEGEPLVYLANVTGNPFLPEKVKTTYFDRQKNIEVEQEVTNPLRQARPVHRKMQVPQIVRATKDGQGKETFSVPPMLVKLPPFSRHQCSKSTADWLTERDARQDELMVGAIKIVRAPTNYEPNDSWSQEEMLAYGEALDASVAWRTHWPVPATGEGFADESRKVKIDLLNALFFKVIDERYTLPPREYVKSLVRDAKPAKAVDPEQNKSSQKHNARA